jgi:NAD/NADP transhydrogenase alpha subunit
MDSVPRMSRAQKMDALSSTAGIAGRIGSDVRPFHN